MSAASRVFWGGALAVAASAGLTGCAFLQTPVPEPEDLLCTWTGEDGDSTLEMHIYGQLTYESIPWDVVMGYDRELPAAEISGEGTWSYGDGFSFRGSSGSPQITLLVTSPKGDVKSWTLNVSGRGDQVELYGFVGDPDRWSNRFTFTRGNC